jgi:hypothetical protein
LHASICILYNDAGYAVAREKGLAVSEEKMLAVRLSTELVDVVRNAAIAEQKSIRAVVEELIRFGLQNTPKKRRNRQREDSQSSRRKLFADFRKAQQRGEVIPWAEKKMLAVRLPPELVEAVRSYAATEQKNIAVVVEEFIWMKLARQESKNREIVTLTQGPASPFRKRRERQSNRTVAYDLRSEDAF